MTPPRENQGNEAGGNRAKPPLNGRSAGRGGEDRDLLAVVVQLPGTDRERPPGLFSDQVQAQPGFVPAFLHRQLEVEDRLPAPAFAQRSEEHTSELQSLMRISYAVFCLKKQNAITTILS